MMRWRSAFLFGGLAAALCLSTALGCVVAPLDDEGEITETESGLEADSQPDEQGEADLSSGDDPLDGELAEPDPIPWIPPRLVAGEPGSSEPGVPVADPDPIPWNPGDPNQDTRKGIR